MKTAIYLDYAAATPMDPAAITAMQPFLSTDFFNPSATYQAARQVHAKLNQARHQVAQVLGAQAQEIIFTAGGTEANNLAIHGVMSQHPNANIVVSSIEHDSVLAPAEQYERRQVPVTKSGLVDIAALDKLIDDQTCLVSVMYANNEVGTVQPIKEIAALIATKRLARQKNDQSLPLYFHTDAAQAANYLDLQVSRLGVDLLTLNGGKIYASKQSGCLYIRSGVTLKAQIKGGGQERSLRSGTENVANVVAFAMMLQKVQADRKAEAERLSIIRDKLSATLLQNVSDTVVNGDLKHRLPNNLHLSFKGIDGERLVMELDELGIMAATGSACSASSDEPSHVLLALGVTQDEAGGSLRISLGRLTTETEVSEAAEHIAAAVQKQLKLV